MMEKPTVKRSGVTAKLRLEKLNMDVQIKHYFALIDGNNYKLECICCSKFAIFFSSCNRNLFKTYLPADNKSTIIKHLRSITHLKSASYYEYYNGLNMSCKNSIFIHKKVSMDSFGNTSDNITDTNKPIKSVKLIGTHDGKINCPDILACVLIRQLPHYSKATIIRTESDEDLKDCEVVVGVGGVFDYKIYRYDHHQIGFNETINSLMPNKPWRVKLSSAGLVYVYHGAEIIASILRLNKNNPIIDMIFDRIYENFILKIDAIENGSNHFVNEQKYDIVTHLYTLIRNFNPKSEEKTNDINKLMTFSNAYDLVESAFIERVLHYGENCNYKESIYG